MVPAWQGALHENNREKIEKNLMTRFCTGRGATDVPLRFGKRGLLERRGLSEKSIF